MDELGRFIKNAVDALETPFFVMSFPDLRCVLCNKPTGAFFSMLLDREISYVDVSGKTFDEIFTGSDKASVLREALERAGNKRIMVRLDNCEVTRPRDGSAFFNIICLPLAGEDDAVKYVTGSANDVTSKSTIAAQDLLIRKTREALAQKDSILSVLNILPFGVVFYSVDGSVRFVNDSFFLLTGYERNELEGLKRNELEKMVFRPDIELDGSPDDPGGMGRAENGLCLATKYEETVPVVIYHIPRVRLGMIDGMVTVVKEKTVELELDRMETTIKVILDNVLSALVITDRHRNILGCSKVCLEIIEMEENEVKGRPLKEVKDLLKSKSRVVSYQTVNGKKYVSKIQIGFTTRSNKSKAFLVNEIPLFSRGGEISGFVSVGSDITSFVEKQEKLIENERLAVIGQLTTGIAHEIKNPLTVISGFAEVTKSKILKLNGNESLKESMLYYQQEIIDNSLNMNRLIVDLLQLARPRRAEQVNINLSGTLEKICNTISPYALQRNVTLIKNLASADLVMTVDPVQIGQVLFNLCNNAIQSMTDGGTLGITTEISGGYLIIQVSDTGCGIKPEDLGKLGTPFFTTKAEGTGLGLCVTYSIIKDYGGKIEVESEVGAGSTFKVYLPVDK